MTSEIYKLKHFHVENYSDTNFTDDEWSQISSDGTCQNRRKGDVFKEPDGSIHYNRAFAKLVENTSLIIK